MRAVVIEPFEVGHRAVYVRWIATAFLDAKVAVTIVGTEGLLRHPEIIGLQSLAANTGGRLVALEFGLPPMRGAHARTFGLGTFQLRMRRWFGRAYDAAVPAKDDVVVVPYLDYCFHAIASLGSPFGRTPWCGITMRTSFSQDHREDDFRRAVRHTLLRRLVALPTTRAIFSIDPRCRTDSENDVHGKLRYLADPAEMGPLPSMETARKQLQLEPESKVVLLFGSIDLRKGLKELLDAVRATRRPESWRVVIAGKQTEDAARFLAAARNRSPELRGAIVEFNSLISTDHVPTLFGSADVVWVGYPGHRAMSGVLVQGAFAGKPMIGQSGTLIGQLLQESGIGVACDICDPTAAGAALDEMVRPEMAAEAGRRGPVSFAEHTTKAFGTKIVAAFDAHAPKSALRNQASLSPV